MDTAAEVLTFGNSELHGSTPDCPLVTFALFAYNQEQFIREAVEGAFSQTYSPLEIILSDDYSSDRTFEIMKEMATRYEGPHRVVVRRSRLNAGLLVHINDVASHSTGEIIVMAAGDDVSYPWRTATLVRSYLSVPNTYAVCSDYDIYGGQILRRVAEHRVLLRKFSLLRHVLNFGGWGHGATYSYRRDCFFWPGQLPCDRPSEVRILPTRAAMLGHVGYAKQCLICWRSNDDTKTVNQKRQITSADSLAKNAEVIQRELLLGKQQGKISSWSYFFLSAALNAAVTAMHARESAKNHHPHPGRILAANVIIQFCRIILITQRVFFDPFARKNKNIL